MDPKLCAQDVLRCQHCKSPGPLMYCDFCQEHICKLCVGEHIFDESKEHKVVPFERRGSTRKCPKHSSKICYLFCEQCDIPICTLCVSAKDHKAHDVVDISNRLEDQKHALRKDLQELKNFIFPTYQKISSSIQNQRTDLNESSQRVTVEINKHGEDLRREIDLVIKSMKSVVQEMCTGHLADLTKQEDDVTCTISEISLIIAELKKLLNSNDIARISAYKSRNDDFRRFPLKHTVTVPSFTPLKINKEQIYQQFGSLSALSSFTEEYSFTMDSPGNGFSPSDRPLIDEPRIITDIKTEYGGSNGLRSLSCVKDEHIWTCGSDKIMRLLNLKGEIVESVQTKSGNDPKDIAVARSGDLVYIDYHDRTVNKLVKNGQVEEVIQMPGWTPLTVCCSLSGDLLVVVRSDDKTQTRVVRYSGSTEKQIIQYAEKGQPLYSSGYIKYIRENGNLDICVSDIEAGAVVVVNQAGKLRFTYTGSPSTIKNSFTPVGLTTDSQSRILIADGDSHLIHILDLDGHFLRLIDNCHLNVIWGICLNTKDNLFVAEFRTGVIKQIEFC